MNANKVKSRSAASLKKLQEVEKVGINILSDDCLMHIIQLLPIVDRVRIERVSKRWRSISLNSWWNFKSLDFTNNHCWGFSELVEDKVNCTVIEQIFKRCGKFLTTIIRTRYSSTVDSKFLYNLVKLCPKIQHLELDVIYPRDFTVLSETYTKLITLAFHILNNDDEDGISLLFEKNKDLKTLKINLGIATGNFLRKLNSQSIENITISCYGKITQDNFRAMSKGFRKLKLFHLVGFDILNNDIMIDITSCYKSLKYLAINHCAANSESMRQIAKLKNLEFLNLSANVSVNDEVLSAIGTNCKLLKFVSISDSSDLVSNAGLASIIDLPNLEELFIENLYNITDKVFYGKKMPKLRRLVCTDSQNLRDGGLIHLIETSEDIEYLNLLFCYKITNKVVKAAVRATKERKNRKMLTLIVEETKVEKKVAASNNSPFLEVKI